MQGINFVNMAIALYNHMRWTVAFCLCFEVIHNAVNFFPWNSGSVEKLLESVHTKWFVISPNLGLQLLSSQQDPKLHQFMTEYAGMLYRFSRTIFQAQFFSWIGAKHICKRNQGIS
uniref:Uncharacterized protein n=1 Tax=Cacopsylla melanoneura TaxID=428564 RepID=A0A8D8LCB2_9HEMI